jgi:hypothetical protein
MRPDCMYSSSAIVRCLLYIAGSTFYIQKLYEAVTTIMIFIEKAASYPDRAIKK